MLTVACTYIEDIDFMATCVIINMMSNVYGFFLYVKWGRMLIALSCADNDLVSFNHAYSNRQYSLCDGMTILK